MAGSSRSRRRDNDGDFPAYFTRHSTGSVGWPFIAAVVVVLAVAIIAFVTAMAMG